MFIIVITIIYNYFHFQLLPATLITTAIKNIFPRNGHVKLIWTCCHGFNGQIYGCIGAWGRACFTDWHSWHDFTIISKLLFSPGHHMWLLAKAFIFDIPVCSLCNSCKSFSCSYLGIITRIPHSRHPSSTESSFQNFIITQLTQSKACVI